MAGLMADDIGAAPDLFDRFPDGLEEVVARDILTVLPRPALIEITGDRPRPLFVSVLLHGNEHSGLAVLQALARRYRDRPPPRSLMIFVGNVAATAAGQRRLPGQPDFNRIWADGAGPYHDLVAGIVERAQRRTPFASIDVHNNSGRNPHYGCINALRPADLHLAASFAPTGVYYRVPTTTQSIAFSAFCPAVTIECGQSGDSEGIERAASLVEETMRLEAFPEDLPGPERLKLYRTLGAVTVEPGVSFAFGGSAADLILRDDLEALNFADLPAGTPLARAPNAERALRVTDGEGRDLTGECLRCEAETISLRRPLTPAMVTRDSAIIRDDCLCYLMERLELPA